AYPEAFERSWLYTELNKARNFKQWFKKGRTVATFMTGIEQFVLRGSIPWTLHRERPDYTYHDRIARRAGWPSGAVFRLDPAAARPADAARGAAPPGMARPVLACAPRLGGRARERAHAACAGRSGCIELAAFARRQRAG